jgi:hypothetical protein
MKRKLSLEVFVKRSILVASALLAASSANAFEYNLQEGWNLVGSTEELQLSKFDNCAQMIWSFDGSWKSYTPNATDNGISSLGGGIGFWVKTLESCPVDTNAEVVEPVVEELVADDIALAFTTDMLSGHTYYLVSVPSSDITVFASALKTNFTDTTVKNSDIYDIGSSYDYTITDGKLAFNDGTYNYNYTLSSSNDDYLEFDGEKIDASDDSIDASYIGRYYFDETKAIAYQQSLEQYETNFFDATTITTPPTVIQHIDMTNTYTYSKLSYDNYGIEGNTHSIDSTGVTLIASAVEGSKSNMKSRFQKLPYFQNGAAVEVETRDLSNIDNGQRVKLQINGYNDGLQDIQPAIQILKDKVVYYQWQSETDDASQTLTNWTTVLDGLEFSNKLVKLATWVADAKVHFYAQVDGQVGYKTFDIAGYENNKLEGWHWSNIKVEVYDGADSTSAKFTKIYTIR